jgi:TPR repeat protein
MRCWKRAAKAGHVEGQLVYGLGLYRGIAGLQEEPQDAHIWLLRALKQVRRGAGCRLLRMARVAAAGMHLLQWACCVEFDCCMRQLACKA